MNVSWFSYQKELFNESYDFWSDSTNYLFPFSSRHPFKGQRESRPGEQAAIEGEHVAAAAEGGEGQTQQVHLTTETPAGTNSSRRAIQGPIVELQIHNTVKSA